MEALKETILHRRMMLIVNPVAGRRLALRYIPEITRIFMNHGYFVTLMVTNAQRDATWLVERYAADFDAVVCVGGDGTLSETVEGVARCGASVPLGYIPAGSTNVFSSCHGISGDILTAANDIAAGRIKQIDLGWFNARSFAFIAAFGAFSWTSYTTPQSLKNVFGPSAYFFDGVKSLPKIKPIHMKVTSENAVHEGAYLFGAVSNIYGFPGLLKFPADTVQTDDGAFEVILIREPSTLLQWQAAISAVMTGNFDADVIEFFQSGELTIDSDEAVAWALDGEYEGGGSGETIKVKNQRKTINLIVKKEE
jgi:YegS/Rv2252/BmrU family lipid kinase